MKKGILFLLLLSTVTAQSQSLKELLYGGKLKSDTGTLIKKTDDLSTKIDTARKKPAEPEKIKPGQPTKNSPADNTVVPVDTAATTATEVVNNQSTAVKDNNKIWKEFMDSMVTVFNAEVMSSKKIKSGTYYILVDYEIAPDGQVGINNVYPSPENEFLTKEIKQRLLLSAPVLNPVLGSTGKPRKAIKKYNFILTKS